MSRKALTHSLTLALASCLALASPLHAATFGSAEAYFTDRSKKTVELEVDSVGTITFSRAVHPIPSSCRDWQADEVRNNLIDEWVPVQGYFVLRDKIARVLQGNGTVQVAIDACTFDKLVVCITAPGPTVCGVAQSGTSRW